jgi:hypothetical protein
MQVRTFSIYLAIFNNQIAYRLITQVRWYSCEQCYALFQSSPGCFPGRSRVYSATRRSMHECILVFKCLNSDLVPVYLRDYFVQRTRSISTHILNTRRKNNLHLSKPKLSLGKITFIFSGTLLYNTLPSGIKNSTT